MLERNLRAVERVFARHPKSYLSCECCLLHGVEVRAIWATPISLLSGARIEWIVAQTGHFDHDALGYYWPAILAYLARAPVYGAWWDSLFTRLYLARQSFTGAERYAIEGVLVSLVAEPAVQRLEQATIAAFLAFWLEDTVGVHRVVTERIQQTWREVLAEPGGLGNPGEVEWLWSLARLWQAPQGLREVSLERYLLLEKLLARPCCVLASPPPG